MEELTIPKFKAKEIEDTLRLVANMHGSRTPVTCFDRKVCSSIKYIQETLGQSQEVEPTDLNLRLEAEFKSLLEGFSIILLDKLLANERKYGFGMAWKHDDWEEDLQRDLVEHTKKGDPRDVAIYALFAWYHNWRTAPQTTAPIQDGHVLIAENAKKTFDKINWE